MLDYLIIALKTLFIWIVPLVLLIIVIWFERKGSSFMQDRTGPNRAAIGGVRLAGIIHLIADVVKLLMKEMMIPGKVNRFFFMVAPMIGFVFVLLAFSVIPYADTLKIAGREIPMQAATLNAGILFILAITSLEVYGAVLAGWSSNNKFALLGGLRATAQMISYEIPLGLSIVGIFMMFGSMQLNEIVRGQGELCPRTKPVGKVVPAGVILQRVLRNGAQRIDHAPQIRGPAHLSAVGVSEDEIAKSEV